MNLILKCAPECKMLLINSSATSQMAKSTPEQDGGSSSSV